MTDAFAAARGRMPAEQPVSKEAKAGAQPLPKDAKAGAQLRAKAEAAERGPEARSAKEDAPAALDRRQERRDQLEGFALPGQPGSAAPIPAPAMPSPQAHPGAFAQMLADLWARENGKGSKEVTVRFGERAWPATGARLVRNAAGALDITLTMGGGERHGDLSGLETALTGAGVDVGALGVEAG